MILVLLAAASALGLGIRARLAELEATGRAAGPERGPVPIEVARVKRGPITLERTFSGTLEAAEEFVAAPKVAGRLARLEVDLGDPVERGQVVARLDDAEFVQSVRQAEAELEVTRANLAKAGSALEIVERALQRALTLRGEGVTSESQLDAFRAEERAAWADLEVAKATLSRDEAALEAARIRFGYTAVIADWSGGDPTRVVSERHADEGGTVSANSPLLSIVDLDPVVGVVFVPERDYRRLSVGQTARLATDSSPGRTFEGRVSRIAPVFRRATRQARVELTIPNHDGALKPGMFVRATIDLEHEPDATVVPFAALIERGGETGVFLLDESGEVVVWRPVALGFRQGTLVQVLDEDLRGHVVTLGHALLEDGARVILVAGPEGAAGEAESPDETAPPAHGLGTSPGGAAAGGQDAR